MIVSKIDFYSKLLCIAWSELANLPTFCLEHDLLIFKIDKMLSALKSAERLGDIQLKQLFYKVIETR